MNGFEKIFTEKSKSLEMGIKLRQLILSCLQNVDESMIGGEKNKLALYSRGDKNNVLCGIQEGKDDSCMFYVHHIETISHERLKFSGKGKHAKRIRFLEENEIIDEDIKWLISKIDKNAPF